MLMYEDIPGGQLITRSSHPAHNLNSDDRVTAQFEEVIFDADAVDMQEFLPDIGESFFDGRPGWFVLLLGNWDEGGFGQCLFVYFFVPGLRGHSHSCPFNGDPETG